VTLSPRTVASLSLSADTGNEEAKASDGLPPRARREPPEILPGWSVGPPDFIGVGVHKAGTTWWYNLLVAHPQVDGDASRKELHMLGQLRRKAMTPERIAWYHRQFPRAPGHKAGEWTPRYMAMPAMPTIIDRVAPEARLLAIVREPVDRYQSGLSQWLDQARATDDGADERAGQREAFMRGFYGRQVQRLVDVVGRERLLVLQYERCTRDAQAEYDRTLAFLRLEPYRLDPALLARRVNATEGEKEPLTAADEERLVAEYAPDVRLLARLVPDLDLDLWPRFRQLAR
jgi:Sulfotransferase domain